MRQGFTLKMLMRQYLNTIAYLQKIKPLPPKPELSNFYHLSGAHKNGELLFAAVCTGVTTNASYKYLK